MPIICDIALKKGIRPERPCGVASIASQVGITCSPIAAAVVAFSAISAENGFEVNNIQIVLVSIPACLCGLMAAAAASYNRGLDLDKDPQFQARLKDPEQYNYIYGNSATTLDKKIAPEAKRAVYVFMLALGVIVMLSVLQIFEINILPSWEGKPLKMNLVIQIVMISAAALMIIFCRAQPKKAVAGPVWQSGMVAVVAIYGIAWMADTYFSNYMPEIQAMLENIVKSHPWSIAIVFFLVSVLINSQGAVVVSMLPLAYSLGIEGPILLGVLPSVYGYFFIPNYPSDIATVNFDRSGTTIIGKYLLNHSFMMPGLICVFVSTIVAYALSMIFF
jgi:anaerobic C4-dicarboxylate transporter DcuB